MIHAEMLNNPSGYVAANHTIGLALDRLPNGLAQACEIRKDEAGVLRVVLGSMSTADFYALAARLKVEIMPSQFASEQERIAHRQHIRRNEERAELATELRAGRKDGKEAE